MRSLGQDRAGQVEALDRRGQVAGERRAGPAQI